MSKPREGATRREIFLAHASGVPHGHEEGLSAGLAGVTRAAMGAKLNPSEAAEARLLLAVVAELFQDQVVLGRACGARLGIMQRAALTEPPAPPEAA